MPKGYHHLTRDTRCQFYTLMKSGDSALIMAKELNIHRSTVYRELKRNSGLREAIDTSRLTKNQAIEDVVLVTRSQR